MTNKSALLELAEQPPQITHPQFGWFWDCPFCKDTGFDLKGLAHHVWMRCEVVETLAQENIEDCRRSHEAFHADALRALAKEKGE